jgi:A118 family predicted phage portal protein
MKIEDLVGLARGTISDANVDARTATELKIVKQRSYATISDNQKALERCLRDVIRVMDKYATLYNLAPEGDYEVSFEWDDSIITDMSEQLTQRLLLMNNGVISREELRQWYFGETEAQAKEAIANIIAKAMANMPQLAE